MKPLVFVMINYNTAPLAEKLLDNIKDYKSIKKIIVVDNHSTDSSYETLKKRENKKIEVIKTDQNKGFSYGMNIGCKRAIELFKDCDILLSNTDIVVHSEDTIKEIKEALKDPKTAVVGPVVYQGKEISRGWKLPTIKEECFNNLPVIGKKFQKRNLLYPESHYKGTTSLVDVVSGCFFAIKSSILEEIGFFDERVFLYYEENILGKKLKEKGYHSVICNNVVILHEHSVSIDCNIGYINKFKQLKESQRYFEETYNQAGKVGLFFLSLTKNLTLATLYIRMFFKGGK